MPTISFAAADALAARVCPRPELASSLVPEWYSSLGVKPVGEDVPATWAPQTAKACMPLLDSFTAGWLFRLPVALRVTGGENESPVTFEWRPSGLMAGVESHAEFQTRGWDLGGYVYKFKQPWAVVLEEGFSALYVHPLNRPELPFHVLSGIVDEGYTSPVQFPFVWTGEPGEHFLDVGLPIAQMIPFRREDFWIEKEQPGEMVEPAAVAAAAIASVVRLDGYRALFHKRKIWRN